MLGRIVEGEIFVSPFTETIFRVKSIYRNTVLLEDVRDGDHQLITEIAAIVRFYKKIGKRSDSFLV